ncbi:putative transcription factor C3H family [Helianthus anomalus]
MVGGTTHQPQQAPQLARTSSSTAAQSTAPEEDELLKRNTDCVYFLASPLTCKKGSECEYRHSDIARVNPRDCWYWLNGNCLNPKCAFRHPPLDGLLGSDVSTPKGPPAPAPYATPKQGVACIFFQKGYCLKGHLCPFLHGPSNSINNKPTQPGPAIPVTEPPKTVQQVSVRKPVEFQPSQGKQPPLPTRNGVDKKIAPPALVPPPVINEPQSNKPNRSYHATNGRIVNGKDAEEYSREPSPGFDVLVDNEVEDAGHDYDVDRDMYRENRDYDHYNVRDGHFEVDRVDHLERRLYPRNDRDDDSDLRHRLSKQRRGCGNELRSAVNREFHADRITRDRHSDRPDQGTLSSRLRGRIKIPGRSTSPTKENNSRVDRVRDRVSDSKFAGPKRLSELKSVRAEHQSNDERFLGKRKHPKTEEDLSFEGPKPLSEILKRKRGVNDNSVINNNCVSSVNIENKETEIIPANKEEHNSVSADFEAENENDKQAEEVENEGEGGLVDEDALLDEELEAYDENRDGDYEYEQMDGEEEDYNMDEGEYVDEDGEEYGKKEGVVYS